jgi:hypothetical protein
LLTVSRSFMNVANSVLWRMAIILKAKKVNLFVYSFLFFFWYHSPNFLDTQHICNISRLRVKPRKLLTFSYCVTQDRTMLPFSLLAPICGNMLDASKNTTRNNWK